MIGPPPRQQGQFSDRRALLKTMQLHTMQCAGLEKAEKPLRASMVFAERDAAGPDDSNLSSDILADAPSIRGSLPLR